MRIGIIGSCIVGSGNRQTAACGNGQSAGFIGNLVVALNLLAGRGDGVAAHGLAGFTAQGVDNLVAIQRAGNRRGQLGLSRTEHLGLVIGSDGNSGRIDGQLSVRCFGYDVLTGSIHRVHGAVGKLRIIGARVGAGGGDGNAGEVRVSGSTGVAFHSLLGAVIGPGLAVGDQLYILIVVEVDHILAGANGDVLAIGADLCAVRNRDGRHIQRLLEGQARNSLGFMYLLRGSVPVVVHGCGQVGAFGVVQVDNVLADSNGQGFLIGAVVVITIDCNDFIGSLYDIVEGHAILYLLSMQDAVGALLQIVHRIAQVGTLGEGAGKGHIFGGHREGAGNFRVFHFPAMENVAVCLSLVRHGHIRAILVACHSRRGRCAVGNRAGVLVGHGVAVPGVVNPNHSAAVGGNGHLYEFLHSEAGIAFGCCLGQFPGDAGQVVGFGQRIPVVCQILLVVLDSIFGIACGGPLGGIGCVSGNGSGNGRIPSGEHIAGTGGILTESGGCRAVAHIFGYPIFEQSLVGYAVRIGHGVGIPVIVNLNHGAAVSGNGHLVEVLRGKSGIRSGHRCGQFPGGTLHDVGIGQRIPVVCQILLVVLNLVSGIVPGNIVDRELAAALHQRTRSGVGGIRGIQLITLELVLRGRDTVRGNGDHGRVVIDPRGTGYVKALLFGAVNGVTDGVLGVLGLVVILHVVQDNNGITCHLAALGGFRGHAVKFVTGVVLPCQRSRPNGDLIRVIYPHGLRIGIGLFHYTLDLVLYGVAYFLDLALVLFPLSDIGHGAGNGCGNLRVPALECIAGTDRISPEPGGCNPVVQIVMIPIRKDYLAVHTVGVSHGVVDVNPGVSCNVGNITHALAVLQRDTVSLYPTGKLIGIRLISRAGRIGRDGHRITVVIGFLSNLGFVIVLINDGVVDGLPFAGQGHVLGRHGEGVAGNCRVLRSPAIEGIAGSSSGRSHSDRLIILTGLLSGQGAGTGRGRSVVIGHLVAVCRVGNRYGYVLSGHGAGDNFLIRGIARDAGRRNTIALFKVHGLGVGCCCLPAVLIYILDGQIEGRFLPLGGEGHVFGGHGEGACLDLVRADLRRSPAGEFVAGPGGLLGNDVHNGAFVLPVRCAALIPAAAVQVIGHEVARHVLGVEGGIRVQGIGEIHLAAGAGRVSVPAVEGVGHAVIVGFGCGQIGDGRELFGIGGFARLVVLGGLPHVAGVTRVPQIVRCGVNTLRLDFHDAVHVLIGVGGVISGNLEGMDMDVLHISFRNGHAKVRSHFGLVGVEDSGPMGIALGDIAVLIPGRPADDTAGNAVAVLVAVLPLGAVHIDGTFTQRSAPTGGIGFGISIGVNEVIEQRTVRRAFRGSYGDLVGLCNTRSAHGGHRIADFRLAGSHCGHVAVLVHGENFLAAALPDRTDHVRIGGLNGGIQLGSGESGHGIHTGQGHGSDLHRLTDNLHSIGSGLPGLGIGHRDLRSTNLQAGHQTRLGQGDHILICGAPLEIRFRTGGSQLGGQLSGDAYEKVVSAGNGNLPEGGDNDGYSGSFRSRIMSMPQVTESGGAISMGNRNLTSRQTGQGHSLTGAADGCLGVIAYSPCSLIRTPRIGIAAASQSNCLALVNCSIGKGDGIGAGTGLGQGVGIAGQQVAQLVQNAAALGLVFHGRLLRVGGGFRGDGLAGGLAVLDGGVVHVDNPALLRAVRGIGHGGDAGGNAVDEGVQGVALGGGDGGSGDVIAVPAAALGKTRGQGDGLPHGDTPIRIFLAFGQSPRGLGLRRLGLRGQSPPGQSPFGLGPFGQSSLGQSLLGLGRLRFLLRFRRNRVRGGSLLRCARICRRLGDHSLRLGHFRSGAMDSESAGGAERHDHAQSQESCNQSSLHGDVPPWIIYVKLTILYGNNGRGESLFPVYARIISCRAMSSL